MPLESQNNFKPTDVAVFGDRILVANVQDHSVYVYGSTITI